jgi:hypothetical protein
MYKDDFTVHVQKYDGGFYVEVQNWRRLVRRGWFLEKRLLRMGRWVQKKARWQREQELIALRVRKHFMKERIA